MRKLKARVFIDPGGETDQTVITVSLTPRPKAILTEDVIPAIADALDGLDTDVDVRVDRAGLGQFVADALQRRTSRRVRVRAV